MSKFIVLLAFISLNVMATDKPEIKIESGKVISNCTGYNKLRESEKILETTNNMLVSAEYLECSLSPNIQIRNNYSELLDKVLEVVRVRQFPLSLAQQVDRNAVLNTLFVSDKTYSLKYDKGHHNVAITIKGSFSKNEYLVWVTDEILNATYRAYYPAVLVVSGSNYAIEPFYESGF